MLSRSACFPVSVREVRVATVLPATLTPHSGKYTQMKYRIYSVCCVLISRGFQLNPPASYIAVLNSLLRLRRGFIIPSSGVATFSCKNILLM